MPTAISLVVSGAGFKEPVEVFLNDPRVLPVREGGLEPHSLNGHQILSLARLPSSATLAGFQQKLDVCLCVGPLAVKLDGRICCRGFVSRPG